LTGLNISLLRDEYEKTNLNVHFDNNSTAKAGIRKNIDGKTTFLYMNKDFLDDFNIPYKYQRFYEHEETAKINKEAEKFVYSGKPMPDYFSEKSQHINQSSFYIFDIRIESRYGNYWEISDMMKFALGAARINATHFIEEIFYDSKGDMCEFKFNDEIYNELEVELELLKIAKHNITQFLWLDNVVMHGNFL
jgi:hypothetical protein